MSSNEKSNKIGLTGGIGSGKTTVTDYLLTKGFNIIDADEISRDIAKPGSPALQRLSDEIGDDVINPDGSLDRAKLAELIFYDTDLLMIVNGIFHSEIKVKMDELLNTYKGIVFISAPLLFETDTQTTCDESWLLVADVDLKAKRAAERDNVNAEDIKARMAHQLTDEEKIEKADIIIENNGSIEELLAKVDELLLKLENKENS